MEVVDFIQDGHRVGVSGRQDDQINVGLGRLADDGEGAEYVDALLPRPTDCRLLAVDVEDWPPVSAVAVLQVTRLDDSTIPSPL